jgi:hypothetical protein
MFEAVYDWDPVVVVGEGLLSGYRGIRSEGNFGGAGKVEWWVVFRGDVFGCESSSSVAFLG